MLLKLLSDFKGRPNFWPAYFFAKFDFA